VTRKEKKKTEEEEFEPPGASRSVAQNSKCPD
jgi:hypothetical protein